MRHSFFTTECSPHAVPPSALNQERARNPAFSGGHADAGLRLSRKNTVPTLPDLHPKNQQKHLNEAWPLQGSEFAHD